MSDPRPLNEALAPALAMAPAVLDALVDLHARRLGPEAALVRLAALRGSVDGVLLDLVWEREDYAETWHYDALIEAPGVGTVSLSVAPDTAVPWPLRNAVRATDQQLVSVNGRAVMVADAIHCLDTVWGPSRLAERLVNLALVEQAVYQLGVEVDEAQVNARVVAFRRANGLLTGAATASWLESRGMTMQQLEARLRAEALEEALREAVVGERWREQLEATRAALDEVSFCRIRFARADEAQEALAALREGKVGWAELAEARLVAGEPSARAPFNVLRRRAMSAEQAALLLGASVGQWVGPVASGGGYDVIKILNIKISQLDEVVIAEAKGAVFDAWLAERRAKATVLWSWGDPRQLLNQNVGWAA